jgi:hypothetical protein
MLKHDGPLTTTRRNTTALSLQHAETPTFGAGLFHAAGDVILGHRHVLEVAAAVALSPPRRLREGGEVQTVALAIRLHLTGTPAPASKGSSHGKGDGHLFHTLSTIWHKGR